MQKLVITMILIPIMWIGAFGKSSYSNRQIGFGLSIGNPIFNYIMSFPFIDLEIGYGGTNGINLSAGNLKSKNYDFHAFVLSALDLIFTIPLIEKLSIGTGIGGNVHISSNKSNLANIEIGFGLRIPITIFYDLTEHIEAGFKIATSIEVISNAKSIAYHYSHAGFKTNIMGGILIKYYI
ncbi:DUF3996 domain-containing protein [Borrelia anserina]|uniref:DUF3996 domain-containing protein n=2 Tax=Borrelia anserina TaxID=143 RepID=W5SPI8_BORAN|nr:DUF3996 domain-containing protein [Borrelia anserina]AHH08538.1 Hypothetical protein BAN_0058900 [Borrelia anserina BA2]APR65007.1 hypothetical protein N187_02765 [Borrelia anserina Es]UPA06930.1 DUF3996 domain-containing protein [Borrelia anserina]